MLSNIFHQRIDYPGFDFNAGPKRRRRPSARPRDRDRLVRIVLQNPNRYPEAGARRLAPWLARLLAAVAAPEAASLGVRFCGDREMRRVNRSFRGKDKTTDVLSFPGDGRLWTS